VKKTSKSRKVKTPKRAAGKWVKPVRAAYVLLETVIATGLLLVGLAVIGAQLQDSNNAVRKMNLKLRAMMLAEMQFAQMDLGLIELESVDAVQEEDFGPRYPDWAWRLTIEETSIDKMFLLRVDVLNMPREDYEEAFDFDGADSVYTVYALRAAPQPLDVATDFGLPDDQIEDVTQKLGDLGIDASQVNLGALVQPPFDDFAVFAEALPTLMTMFQISKDDITRLFPPDMVKKLTESGLLGGDEAEETDGENPQPSEDGSEAEQPEGDEEVQE